jgi:hypothetical protein
MGLVVLTVLVWMIVAVTAGGSIGYYLARGVVARELIQTLAVVTGGLIPWTAMLLVIAKFG